MKKNKEKEVAEEIKEEKENIESEDVAKEVPTPSEEIKKEPSKDDTNDKYLRLMADFQNFRKRSEKEKNDIYQFANEKIVVDILGVVDNFDRALKVETQDEAFKNGIELILKQLLTALEKAGVKEIEALGKEFDPNFHSAVMMEDSEEYESNHVTEVIQKGYTLNNKVVRPSMVKVAN